MKILKSFDRFMTYLAQKSQKAPSELNECLTSVELPSGAVSIYNTKGFFLPDYDKVSVDLSKKGWQKKLKFNDKNTNPTPSCFVFSEFSTVNHLKPKPDIEDAEHVFYQTVESVPMAIETAPKAGIMIDNFSSPGGTISIEGNLSDTFYTKELYQCVGVSVVDRVKNLQKFMHFFIYSDERDSLRLIKFLTRGMKEPEITLVPGTREETNQGLEFLVNAFKDFFPDLTPKFLHVPESFKVKDTFIGLHEGRLFCTEKNPELVTEVNPKGKIIFI